MTIPTKWSEVSLQQYIELETLPKLDTDNEEEILKRKIVEAHILTGLSVEEIDKLPFGELYKIKELLSSKRPYKIRKRFKLNGIRYKVQLNPTKLNSDRFLSVLNLSRKDPVKKMPQILLNICTPYKRTLFGRKYYDLEPDEFVKRIDDFKELKMSIANPILVFFYNLSEVLQQTILKYSENKMTQIQKEMKQTQAELLKLQESTDG